LKSISGAAVLVESVSTPIRSAISFAAGFNPYKCVDKLVAGICRRANSESSSYNIAPIAPFLLLGRLYAVAT
jgi:hypothetical protein